MLFRSDLYINLERSKSLESLCECINTLHVLEQDKQLLSAELADKEEQSLRQAILGKVALGLYGHALETLLDEASEAETELEWWSDLGRSRGRVAYYLLQSESPAFTSGRDFYSPPGDAGSVTPTRR